MSALSHAKQPENTKSPEQQPAVQQAGPASNMEALALLGMGALGKAAAALSEQGPQSLEEEVALMAQTSPAMLPVLLDALPDMVLTSVLPSVLGFRSVRDWLLMARPDLLSQIEGGAELLIDGLIPVGHSLKLAIGAELSADFELAGANSIELTRDSAKGWALVFEAEVAVKAGLTGEEASKQDQGLLQGSAKAEGKAQAGIAQTMTSNFSSDLAPDELMQALSGQLDLALLKSLVTDTLTSMVPDSVSVECAMTADLEGKGDLKVLGAIAPALHARLLEASATFEAGLSGSSRMTVTELGDVTNEFLIDASTTIGPSLQGLLPMAHELQTLAKQESWTLSVVFENGAFKHIVVDEDMQDMISQRVFLDPADLLTAQQDRFVGAGDRLQKLAAGMSVTVRQPLPEAEIDAVSRGMQSVRLGGAGVQCSYELQQTVRFAQGVEVPEYLNTSNFAGSDLALFQALVQCALTGESGTLNVDQATAREMLVVEEIRLVGAQTGKAKAEQGGAEISGEVTHSFDVPYNGPTKLL